MSSKKKYSTSISIAIPAYNEEGSVKFILNNTLKELSKYFKDYEIILVNDGSTDNTGVMAEKLAKNNKKIRIIHQENKGFSKALLTAIKASKKEFISYMPADGQILIEDMRHCFEVMSEGDLILGYRGGRSDYAPKRIFFSYGYLLLLLILFDIKFMDVGWVNIWRTKKVKKLKFTSLGGIFILTEIVVRFKKLGYKIIEAPSYYRPRLGGVAKNGKFSVAWLTFINALKLWIELKLS